MTIERIAGRRRRRGRARARVDGPPAPARRVRRPGPHQGEPGDPHRCRPPSRRAGRPHPPYGPPGLGKTTLANIVAAEMGAQIRTTSGPAIERAGDLAAVLTAPRARATSCSSTRSIASATSVEEILYPAMEDFALDVVLGKGPGARTVRLQIEHITVIGATTRVGSITGPLRDRFGVTLPARLLHAGRTWSGSSVRSARHPGRGPRRRRPRRSSRGRSRGTPRIANRLLKRVRDFAQVRGDGDASPPSWRPMRSTCSRSTTAGSTRSTASCCGPSPSTTAAGRSASQTMAATISEPVETLEDVVEPYLMQIGLLARTLARPPADAGGLGAPGPDPTAGAPASVQPGLFDGVAGPRENSVTAPDRGLRSALAPPGSPGGPHGGGSRVVDTTAQPSARNEEPAESGLAGFLQAPGAGDRLRDRGAGRPDHVHGHGLHHLPQRPNIIAGPLRPRTRSPSRQARRSSPES